jgi:hypothetical protein
MAQHRYGIGDMVALKSGAFRSRESTGLCRIVSVLPEAYGLAQYRVRFDAENWERRITQDDIDKDASPRTLTESDAVSAEPSGSWVNLNKIKIKR